ncbi:MAG: hypothetical protein SNJ54_11895 [Anaerolineae bacterium]
MNAFSPLHPYLIRWERRWRLQRLMGWLPYALALMSAAGSVGVLLAWLVAAPSLGGAAFGALAAAVVAGGWLLRRVLRPMPRAARHFEQAWGLQERLSTALEVNSGRIPASPLTERLLTDAVRAAEAVDARAKLPLPLDGRGWLLASLAGLLLLGLLVIPPPERETPPALSAGAQVAVQEAVEALAQVIAELSQDTALAPDVREGLLATLEARLAALQEGTLSAEAAFAALSEAQNALASAAQEMAAQAQAQEQALNAAAQAFSPSEPPPTSGAARPQSLSEALQSQLESASVDPTAARQQQQAARQAADAVRQQFPQLAAALDQAANADTPDALRSALEQAAQQAQQAAQQQQRQQQAARAMQQRTEFTQQQAEALAQSEANASSSAEGAAGSEETGQPQAETGLPQPGQQETGQGAEGETSQAEAGAGDQAQAQQGAQAGEDAPDAQTSASGDSSSGDTSASGEATSEQEASGNAAGSRQSSPGDGEGEAEAATIFTGDPSRVFGAEPVILPGDPGSAPARPADTVSLPEGGQNVPFRSLLDRYTAQAGRALEANVVPSGLAEFIRSYFSGLSR